MRRGDIQYGNLDLNTNDITGIGNVSKALSSAIPYWKLIQEVWLPEDAATIEFNSIPQNFRHLILMCSLRTDRADPGDGFKIRFNNDTGSNYDASNFGVDAAGSLVNHGGDGPGVSAIAPQATDGDNASANSFNAVTIYILDYANTSRHKAVTEMHGNVRAASVNSDITTTMTSGRWRSTDAIKTITITPEVGPNFKSGSMASLYGTDV